MKVVAAMIVIAIHVLFDIDYSMKTWYIALAKCVVVNQQEKEQTKLSDEENKEATDMMTNGEKKANHCSFFLQKLLF